MLLLTRTYSKDRCNIGISKAFSAYKQACPLFGDSQVRHLQSSPTISDAVNCFLAVNPTTSHEVQPHSNLILEPVLGGQKEAEEEDKAIMVVETLAVEVNLYFENKTMKYGQVFHM